MSKQLNIINAVIYSYDVTSSVPRHRHEDIAHFFYILEGKATYILDGKNICAAQGQFIYAHPGLEHEMKSGLHSHYRILDIKFRTDDFWLKERLAQVKVLHQKSEETDRLFLMIVGELENINPFFDKLISLYIEAVVYQLVRKSEESSIQLLGRVHISYDKLGTCTKKVLAALQGTSIASEQSGEIGEIARLVGYNKKYMCKCFSEEMGVSISEFRRLVRVDRAKELLETSEYSIREIAEMLGYSGESYFIRMFKSSTGITPLQYRLSGRKIDRKINYTTDMVELKD